MGRYVFDAVCTCLLVWWEVEKCKVKILASCKVAVLTRFRPENTKLSLMEVNLNSAEIIQYMSSLLSFHLYEIYKLKPIFWTSSQFFHICASCSYKPFVVPRASSLFSFLLSSSKMASLIGLCTSSSIAPSLTFLTAKFAVHVHCFALN